MLPGGLWLISKFEGEFGGVKFGGTAVRLRPEQEEVRRHVDRLDEPDHVGAGRGI